MQDINKLKLKKKNEKFKSKTIQKFRGDRGDIRIRFNCEIVIAGDRSGTHTSSTLLSELSGFYDINLKSYF